MGMIWDFGEFNDKTALIDDKGNSLTYSGLESESAALAGRIGRRCLTFILCRNEIGSVIGYTAFVNHSIVPVMVSGSLEDSLLDSLLEIYKPEYIWKFINPNIYGCRMIE